MTDEIMEYGDLFDRDTETAAFRLEALSLRISHMIAEALDDQGMSRTDLAHALDVSAPMVTKILSGRSNFTLKTMLGVADALDYDFDVVFKPKGYCVAVDYVFAEMPRAQSAGGQEVTNVTKRAGMSPDSTKPVYGDLPWSFSLCDAPSSPPERAAA